MKHQEPSGMTIEEIQRALQVPMEELQDYFQGITVTKDSHGNTIIPYEDIQCARQYYLYGIYNSLD